jgi:hypothetical protein
MIPGLDSVSARALHRVVTAIAADELDVRPKEVSVHLADDRGMLAVTVTSPLRVAALDGQRDQAGMLARCAGARDRIQSRTRDIAGSDVRSVALRISRAAIRPERRVR